MQIVPTNHNFADSTIKGLYENGWFGSKINYYKKSLEEYRVSWFIRDQNERLNLTWRDWWCWGSVTLKLTWHLY